ncbi:MAG: hypothetical protein QGH15_17280 [Kiritimatiellia bacterium]|jgi:hypothetical protein|nr:hypothetical protein [Kiritimatiellia bacterium]
MWKKLRELKQLGILRSICRAIAGIFVLMMLVWPTVMIIGEGVDEIGEMLSDMADFFGSWGPVVLLLAFIFSLFALGCYLTGRSMAEIISCIKRKRSRHSDTSRK